MTRQSIRIYINATCLCLLAIGSLAADGLAKWSRQLEESGPGEADSFDWVPLAQPVGDATKDRSANGRVLTYSQSFPPNARFGDLSKPHNAPVAQQQHAFDFPYQFQRFLNAPQAQSLRQNSSPFKSSGPQSQEPTSQSFFKFEMPYHGEGGRPAGAPPTLQTGYQIQHTFGGGAQAFNSPLFNQQPLFPPEFHPPPLPSREKAQQQYLQQKPLHQNYIEDTLPVKHHFRESKPVSTQQPSLQSVTPQVFSNLPEVDPIFELNKPTSFQSPFQHGSSGPSATPSTPNQEQHGQEDVQLLYVPYDTLYNQQQPHRGAPTRTPSFELNKFNVNPGLPAVNPYQINQFYTQDPRSPQDSDFYTTSTTSRPRTTSSKPSNIFQSYAKPQYTTAKPKPKAHQPPLAMFLLRSSSRPTQSDVVAALRNSNTIAVIDAPQTKQTPPIFVGPGGMPIPNGYVKFDLPYLSQLQQSRDLHDVPFFVAPLSYRTPNGFNKILLPEPHVGSIVVNRAKDYPAPTQQSSVYNTPSATTNDIPQYTTPTQRSRPHRVKQPAPPTEYYPEVVREPNQQKNRNQFEVTTQRGTLQPSRATVQPSRGNKFSYFYDQDGIQEVTSPKATKLDRPKKKRPQNVQVDRPAFSQTITNPYAQFQPMPNQISNDDYYKVPTSNKPTTTTSTSTSTSTSTTSTTSTTPDPPTFFTYSTSPQVEFHSTSGQLYPDYNATPAQETVEEYVPRFTTRPPPATSADEEYRMKQYFRQQDAFRKRPKVERPTNPPFEQVQYTPVSLDYEREVTIPSTTQRTTTTKQRVTFYMPTATPATTTAQEIFNTVPPRIENISEYHQSVQTDSNIPINHRPSYNQNEIPDGNVEYDPNPYQLPSELPPLTPNLPGLVNDLQEKEKQNAVEQTESTTPFQEQEQTTRPTRRPINRVRKPVVSKVTSSVSYSETETASKRPSHRVRRPYGSRSSASSSSTSSDSETSSTTTTRRPTSQRNSFVRNPNRVRYQPTPEERQSLRLKPRKQYNGSKKVSESEDIEYQRDVLNQNYPVFKAATAGSRKPSTSPTAIPKAYGAVSSTSEGPTSETQQIYTVTPSNSIDNEQSFPAGLLEPMQIAQQYNEYSNNYGPGYFPNQEDLNPTETVLRNEINPVYSTVPSTTTTTTTKTTTTEEPQTTTRRSPFIRRNYPRLRTTTEAATTTTPAAEERATIRSRIPPRKVIKVRTRNRRPNHPASSTTAPEDEVQPEQKNNYRKSNRYNQNNANANENDVPIRRRYKTQFQLDGQESQWSPALKTSSSNNNSFKPLNSKDARDENTTHKFENEPDIVTAGPEQSDQVKLPDTYEINVSANFGSRGTGTKTTLKAPNLKPEKSFAELLEEVMGKAPEVKPTDSELDTKTTDGTYFESQKTTVTNHRLNRRGKWKKLKTSAKNNESFETAESQNLGPQLLNSLLSSGQNKEVTEESAKELSSTAAMTPPSTTAAAILTTTTTTYISTTPTPADEYEMTTSKQLEITTMPATLPMDEAPTTQESATRRLDTEDLAPHGDSEDLETQPSLFSEVKKQLHDLFAIEESDDHAVTAALGAVGKRRQEYTSIQRAKPESTTAPPEVVPVATEPTIGKDGKKEFHKDLMKHIVYATSTSTQMTSETEICYRGRCIRSEDLPPNHKLN